jgi:hypothetical protein
MWLKAELLRPIRLSTRSFVVMTGFRLHNAHITLRQFDKTRIAITLTEAFFSFIATMHTKNLSGVNQFQGLT